MLINPKIAIENKWITHSECTTLDDWKERKFISPNAIDFTVDTLFNINEDNPFVISEDRKIMRGGETFTDNQYGSYNGEGNYWRIFPHTVVDFMSDVYVDLPEGIAATLIIRSTFNRNGLFLTSGLYDSGFKGHIAGTIHNRSGFAFIAPGTRLGQICFWKSDSVGMYMGGYNHEQGTHHAAPHELDCDGAESRDRKYQ